MDIGKMKSHLLKLNKKMEIGLSMAVVMIGFGYLTYRQIKDLETGLVESTRVWAPIAFMYNLLGLWGAVVGFIAIIFLCLFISCNAWKKRKIIISQIGQDTFKKTLEEDRKKTPQFLRGTNEKGHFPKSTIILALVFIILLLIAFVAFRMGIIH